jgi:hypothetical protein
VVAFQDETVASRRVVVLHSKNTSNLGGFVRNNIMIRRDAAPTF